MSSAGGSEFRYRRLLGYLWPHRAGWALIIAATLAGSVLTVAQPWPMKVLVDHVLASEPWNGELGRMIRWLPGAGSKGGLLLWASFGTVLIFLLNSAADVVLTFAWVRVGQRMVFDLTEDLFNAVQRRSLIFHTRNSVGDLLSRITGDSWGIYTLVDTLLVGPLYALTTAILIGVTMFRMSPKLTLVALAAAPFMGGFAFFLGKPVRKLAEAKRQIQGLLHAHVQQTLRGIPIVQAFVQEAHEQQRFEQFAESALKNQRGVVLMEQSVGLASGLVTTLGTAAVLFLGAMAIIHDESLPASQRFTLGDLLLFLAYLKTLQGSFKSLAGAYTSLQSTRAMLDRVLTLLNTPPEVKEPARARPPQRFLGHVQVRNATFGYEPGRPVLKEISLEVQPGSTLAIVGATGAGKSTLVSLIPRLVDPWEGIIEIDGRDLRELPLKFIRQNVAIVHQEAFLFPVSIAQNIAYGRPEAGMDEIEAAARAANAHEFIAKLPQGYQTVVGERGATLSGGERQRISIARALLKDAPVLILDEPTSALDAQTESLLLEALERLMVNRTTLIIAHRLSTIRRADRIIVLDQGRIIEEGTHRQLLDIDGIFARLHALQTHERHPALAAVS